MSVKINYCEFCDIFNNKKDLIIFQNKNIFAIEDIDAGTSKRHILVYPIMHVENVNYLTIQDYDLLDEIHKVSQQILEASHPKQEYRFGYHTPPHISIDHLHYHAIVLPIKDMFFNLVKFGKLLTPLEEIKEKIKNLQQKE